MHSKNFTTRETGICYGSRGTKFCAPTALKRTLNTVDRLFKVHSPFKKETLKLIDNLSILAVEEEIIEIAQVYIQHHLMPDDIAGDALHLAIASYYKCDFLLTWNCKHLANVNKIDHIRRVNMLLDLFTPMLITPLEFIEEESYDD